MVKRPQDVDQLTADERDTLQRLIPEIDERLEREGEITYLDTYDFKHEEDGRCLADRIWDTLVEKYRGAGWNAHRQGRIVKILK